MARSAECYVKGLEDKENTTVEKRVEFINALGNLGPEAKEAVGILCKVLLKDTPAELRTAAARALGKIKDDRSVTSLCDATDEDKEKVPLVRYSAAIALGNFDDKRAVKALKKALKDRTKPVRYWAVWALGEMMRRGLKDESVINALIEVRRGESTGTKVHSLAASILTQFGDGKTSELPDKNKANAVARGIAENIKNKGEERGTKNRKTKKMLQNAFGLSASKNVR